MFYFNLFFCITQGSFRTVSENAVTFAHAILQTRSNEAAQFVDIACIPDYLPPFKELLKDLSEALSYTGIIKI